MEPGGNEFRTVARSWGEGLTDLVGCAREHLLLVSPYVTGYGVDKVLESLENPGGVRVHLATDLGWKNLVEGSVEPEALVRLWSGCPRTRITYAPRLHAKVYIADTNTAMVTSGNLTRGGLETNIEYGVMVSDAGVVERIRREVEELLEPGSVVTRPQLEMLAENASGLRDTYRKAQASTDEKLQKEFAKHVQATNQELVNIQTRGESPNSVFSRTILYLLKTKGPLRTEDMHPLIQGIHAELCDDGMDYVNPEGLHFGKNWKHLVRNGQQFLKGKRLIERDERGFWRLVP